MVMPAHYTCSKCFRDFTGPDFFELPILCPRCKRIVEGMEDSVSIIDLNKIGVDPKTSNGGDGNFKTSDGVSDGGGGMESGWLESGWLGEVFNNTPFKKVFSSENNFGEVE